MKKQASLFNFFKKSASDDSLPPPQSNPPSHDTSTEIEKPKSIPLQHLSTQVHDLQPSTTPIKASKSQVTHDSPLTTTTTTPKTKRVKKTKETANDTGTKGAKKKSTTTKDSHETIPSGFSEELKENIAPSDEDTILFDETPDSNHEIITSTPAFPRQWVSKRRGRVLTRAVREEKEDVWVDLEKVEEQRFNYDYFFDATPKWARVENKRDAEGRRPGDLDYDPTTLFIPPGALDDLTPAMKQYWQIKSQNFDKILFFKVGKFFEIYYDDALECHEKLGLRWRGARMETNFPDISLEKFAYRLVSQGLKVCIVEQSETPSQMDKRVRAMPRGKKEKIIKRDPVQILSRGTYVDYRDAAYEPKILLSLRHRDNLIAVTFLDVGSNILSLGYFFDDENFTVFKMFVNQIRPVEIVYETMETNPILLKILKNNPSSPTFSPLEKAKDWNLINAYSTLEQYYSTKQEWPEALQEITNMDSAYKDLIMGGLSGLINYLTKMLIIENVFQTARYEVYDINRPKDPRMVIDSQAIQHLELMDVSYFSGALTEKGSLLSYIDNTSSTFGKRLLRKWLCAPLLDVQAINDRYDAIEDLNTVHELREKFRKDLKQILDLERMCGRMYNQSTKSNENVFMFEEIGTSRLREFKNLLENLKKARNIIYSFRDTPTKSPLLKRLITMDDYELVQNGQSLNMPDIVPLLKNISAFVTWEGPNQDKPNPKFGVQIEYDAARERLKVIEDELNDYLKEIQKYYKGSREICFANTRHRYEIEVPTSLIALYKRPDDFEFSSKKKGFERFITPKIVSAVKRIEAAEEEVRINLNLFIWSLFKDFQKHYRVWDRFVDGLAQLDCLCSLSVASFQSDGITCRPEVYPLTESPFLEVREMRHPCISMTKANFIPNDIIVGNPTEEDHTGFVILLTGPNMGGKSTILRQASIAVILAQIGCFVPASSCKMSVVDRIFTRIGASDNLLEGKSTFFIEMEETVNVLKYGTVNSLVIMDELGRGTSTFDGVSIAYSVLSHLINKLKCRTFFATHYHVLLEEFRGIPEIAFYHMAYKLDEEEEKVTFLYKLKEGECGESFGLNIAKLSGMPVNVVSEAKRKAEEFIKNMNIRGLVKEDKIFNKVIGNIKKMVEYGGLEDLFEEIEAELGRLDQ